MSIKFEWDPNKAVQNLRKHQVSFEEAATVFQDTLSITVPDPDHVEGLLLGKKSTESPASFERWLQRRKQTD